MRLQRQGGWFGRAFGIEMAAAEVTEGTRAPVCHPGRVPPRGRASPSGSRGLETLSPPPRPNAARRVPWLSNAVGVKEHDTLGGTKLAPHRHILPLTESRSLGFGYCLGDILKVMLRNSQCTFVLGPGVDTQYELISRGPRA